MTMKKILALSLVLASLLTMCASAQFSEESQTNINIDDIDVFILSSDTPNEDVDYVEVYETQQLRSNLTSVYAEDGSVIQKLTNEQKNSNAPIMELVQKQAQIYALSGGVLESAIIVLPENNPLQKQIENNDMSAFSARNSDPNYWLNLSTYYSTYNGYKFRYVDIWGVGATYDKTVSLDNSTAPSYWSDVFKKSIKLVVSEYINNATNKVSSTLTNIGQIISAKPSVNISYDKSSEAVHTRVFVAMKTRHIVIEDLDNKNSQFTYVPWGYSQFAEIDTTVWLTYLTSFGKPVQSTPQSRISTTYTTNNSSMSTMVAKTYEYYKYFGYSEYREYLTFSLSNLFN